MTEKTKPLFEIVAPVFPVTNMENSLRFYTEKLLFQVGFEWSDTANEPVSYAILQQGNTELHLTARERAHKTTAYFFVHGLREYFEAVKKIGVNSVSEINDYPWDMREFEVTDPDGNTLIFGEHLSRIDEP